MGNAMNDDSVQTVQQHRDEQERALWRHELQVIEQAISTGSDEGTSKLLRAAINLERDVERLARCRDLQAAGARAPHSRDREPSKFAGENAWLDRLIREKRQRQRQLMGLQKNMPCVSVPVAHGPTAETICKPSRRDPIQMLSEKGKLEEDQVRAAIEIRRIYEAVSRDLGVRTQIIGAVRDRNGWRCHEVPGNLSWTRRRRFLPWAEQLRCQDPGTLDIVLRITVFGASVFTVSRRHKLSWASCVEKLCRGLDLYWKLGTEVAATGDSPDIPRRECP